MTTINTADNETARLEDIEDAVHSITVAIDTLCLIGDRAKREEKAAVIANAVDHVRVALPSVATLLTARLDLIVELWLAPPKST